MKRQMGLLLGALLLFACASLAGANELSVNLAQSGAVLSGYWLPGSAGNRIYLGGNNGSQLDALVTGKVLKLTCYSSGSTNVTVTVDGVSYTPTFSVIRAWTTLTVTLGAEGAHALTIKLSYSGTGFFIDTGTGEINNPTFTVKGAAPAIGAPPGFGPQYQLSDTRKVTPFIQAEGGLAQTAVGGYPSVYTGSAAFNDQGVYFSASATGSIEGWMYGSGNLVTVYQDGVKIGSVNTPASSTYQWVPLCAGDGTEHRYGVVSSYPLSPGFYLWSLMTVGGTLTDVQEFPRPRLVTFGDSIVQGLRGTGNDSSQAFSQRLGASLGWAVYNRGFSGSTVHEFPSGIAPYTTESGEARTATDVVANAAGADAVVILYGTNDLAQAGGTESIAQFQTSYQNMLSAIVAGVAPTCPITCIGILPRTTFSPNQIASWNAAIQAAITAVGAANVTYVDPSGWGLMQNNGPDAKYTDPNQNTADGLHPNFNGYSVILANLTPVLAPPDPPTITSAAAGTSRIGEPVEYQTSASGAPTSYAASGLPAGLAINAGTGLISGTPTAAGTFPVNLTATNASGTGALTLQLTIVSPVVTIAATVPTITVNGGEFGQFTLTVPSAGTQDLDVDYKAGGTATPGVDYVALSGVAKIHAGKTSAVINVKPLGNLGGANSKTVKLTLLSGADYTVAPGKPPKLKIISGN